MNIALTLSGYSAQKSIDEQLMIPALWSHGIRATLVSWEAAIDWSQYDAVVVRSCWDQMRARTDFLSWANHLESAGTVVINHPRDVLWNADSSYYQGLTRAGVRTIPTLWVQNGEDVLTLEKELELMDWGDVEVTAEKADSFRFELRDFSIHRPKIEQLAKRSCVKIQPIFTVEPGAWSLFFILGKFTHAVWRRLGLFDEGDVRLGSVSLPMLQLARAAIEHSPRVPFCRVDLIAHQGLYYCQRLDAVDPRLHLNLLPKGATIFAHAIIDLLRAQSARPSVSDWKRAEFR